MPSQRSADPYDVPASPFRSRAADKKAASSPASVRERESMARLRHTGIDAATSLSPTQVGRVEAPLSAVRETRSTPRKDTPTKATPKSSRRNTPAKVESVKKATPGSATKVNGHAEAPVASPAIVPNSQIDNAENEEDEVESFKKHRVDKEAATVDILVAWVGGEVTWEPEADLQAQVPHLVYEYWDTQGSRDVATGLDTYHVFKVMKRTIPSTGKKPQYQIQWVGYRPKESSWEPEDTIKEIAPEALADYEAKHGPAPTPASTTATKKRAGGRGPGRPRKKAKSATNGDE